MDDLKQKLIDIFKDMDKNRLYINNEKDGHLDIKYKLNEDYVIYCNFYLADISIKISSPGRTDNIFNINLKYIDNVDVLVEYMAMLIRGTIKSIILDALKNDLYSISYSRIKEIPWDKKKIKKTIQNLYKDIELKLNEVMGEKDE